MYVGKRSNSGALSMWTHASVHIDCACFLIMNKSTHHTSDNRHSVDLSHTVWTHETNIAQCPQIHTSQFSLEWMLSVLCMHSMWCQCILCTTSCACRLCVYCVCNVPVSGTASQYMLLCMHIIAAWEFLVLVAGITSLINHSYSLHGECLELFSRTGISLQAQECTAVLPFLNFQQIFIQLSTWARP